MHVRGTVAAAAAAFAVLPAAAASAATQNVFVGTPPSAQGAMQKLGADANQFFPSTLTVRAGDTVKFTPVGFHNVDFPARGQTPAPFALPTGKKLASENDAAGAAFWFNGQDELGFNPILTTVNYGKSYTVPSAKRVSSGLPLAPKPKPLSVKFTKAGVYTYFCDLHAGMKGTVRVVGKTKPAPTAAGIGKLVNSQVKADKTIAAALPKVTVPADTVLMGNDKSNVHLYAFLPGMLKVKPGTTVTFKMSAPSSEAHTATFGPGNPEKEPKSYLGTLASSFEAPAFAGAAVYPSDVPSAPASYGPTLHGNGFWNSGVLDADSRSPLPSASTVRFDTPGTFTYYCLIHPFMKGQVVVG